jgi:hypothetical protein
MTPLSNCAVTNRLDWSIAGVDPARAMLHHQTPGSSKVMRRCGSEPTSRRFTKPPRPLNPASRATPTDRASLKSP